MANSPLEALHRLQELAAAGELDLLCEEFGVEVLVVFGSVAHPARAHTANDLDVAVRFRSAAAPRLLDFIASLDALLEGTPLDVMDLRHAGVIGRFKALGAGIPLYEAEPGLWASMQSAAVLEYMDTADLRRLDRELLKDPA
jgi:predicted nucleotidyltransferase